MKIAVVGSGVSGPAATWLLNKHSDHEVHLFEADDRVGGHANTVSCQINGEDVSVDTGFIVFNPTTYPNFLRFLSFHPNVKILPTEMTFSVSRDRGVFEWTGSSLATVFCQPSRLLDPGMWRLPYHTLRFNACARELLVGKNMHLQSCSVAEYLVQEGYSDTFRDDYLIPMTAAIWSTPPDKCLLDFPVRSLFMPKHRFIWSACNYLTFSTVEGGGVYKANVNKVSLTCIQSLMVMKQDSRFMNLLQHLPESTYGPVLVALNLPAEPASGTVAARFHYDHPILNAEPQIHEGHGRDPGHRGIVYAGAWLGYSFHEDGFTFGLRAVTHHIDGVRLPFEIASADRPVRPAVWAACAFELLEWSGARRMPGVMLSFVHGLVARLLLVDVVKHGDASPRQKQGL